MLYSKIFLSCLNEDLKPYQVRATRGLSRKRLNQVPQYAKGRGDLNSKVESLRKRDGGSNSAVLSPSDINYIKQRYNIKDIQTGKELGTTGIKIVQLPTGGWTIRK